MPQFEVVGHDRETGAGIQVQLDAADAQAARKRMEQLGVVVAAISAIEIPGSASAVTPVPSSIIRRNAGEPQSKGNAFGGSGTAGLRTSFPVTPLVAIAALCVIAFICVLTCVLFLLAGNHRGFTGRASHSGMVEPSGGEQTKAAWNEMNQIAIELRSRLTDDPIYYWEQSYVRYAEISRDHIDTDLASFIKERIAAAIERHDLLVEYNKTRNQITQQADDTAKMGSTLGSMNRDDPQGGQMAGTLLFGAIAGAQADSQIKELDAKFEPQLTESNQRLQAVEERQKALSETLAQRYGLTFDK